MHCIILGCGGSNGVPQIGCRCWVCKSSNPKNKRTRPSILITNQSTQILIDTSPDFRTQALREDITKLDAIFYTHAHSDHIRGVDDCKLLKSKSLISAYMDERTYNIINKSYEYLFVEKNPFYPPRIKPNIIKEYDQIVINDLVIQSFTQNHHSIKTQGYRVGNFAYSTDVDTFPLKSIEYLRGIEVWILDCQRYHPVPAHNYLESILDLVALIEPRLTILTHMTHGIEYEEFKRILPKNIIPGYDGMMIDINQKIL